MDSKREGWDKKMSDNGTQDPTDFIDYWPPDEWYTGGKRFYDYKTSRVKRRIITYQICNNPNYHQCPHSLYQTLKRCGKNKKNKQKTFLF